VGGRGAVVVELDPPAGDDGADGAGAVEAATAGAGTAAAGSALFAPPWLQAAPARPRTTAITTARMVAERTGAPP
jgi:hypothetical protein